MEIKDYPNYLIYNNGQIYSKNRYLRLTIRGDYYRVQLYCDGIKSIFSVHILVAQYFCENPDNKTFVNHKDGNKLNNHYTNLEWVTQSENSRHAHNLGLNKRIRIVNQYAKEDKDKCKPLRTFNNCREAAESVNTKNIKAARSHIARACTGIRETAYGYRWGYGETLYDYLKRLNKT